MTGTNGSKNGCKNRNGVEKSTWATKAGLAQMLKGGVIMDVVERRSRRRSRKRQGRAP